MAVLNKYNIPFTEISVTKYPKKRKDMLSLSSRSSTPQVFFNTRHVGGADETLTLLEHWNTDKSRGRSPMERYKTEIEEQPDPFNPRFAIPDYAPVVTEPGPLRGDAEFSVLLPNGEMTSVLQTVETLKKILPTSSRVHKLTTYKNSFTARQAVTAIMGHYKICEDKAISFGRRLQDLLILNHVCEDHRFEDSVSDKYFFRLTCHATPKVLNSYRVWTEQTDPNSLRLMGRLADLLSDIESAMTDSVGKVDYKSAPAHSHFTALDEATCELQGVNLAAMDKTTLTAFGINLYNFMIKYAFMKVGIGKSDFDRLSCYSSVCFNVGGFVFSFQEWENGILRGNRKAPYSLGLPFGKKDPRHQFVIGKPDGRIHFALNSGATSCSSVNRFTAENLDEELSLVAISFCEGDENVMIDPKKREVHLSTIFNWYRVDFAPSKKELPKKLVEYLRGGKAQTLERMLDNGDSVKVSFISYDWSTNASNFVPFDSDALKADTRSVKSLLHKSTKESKSVLQ